MTQAGFELLSFRIAHRIATLELNDPETRNAITGETMLSELDEALRRVAADPHVTVLIVTGSGSAFSSGGNVHNMRDRTGLFSGPPDHIAEAYRRGIQSVTRALATLDVATIAAVNGPAIGAGFDLALMCDLRVASTTARFGHTFASLGIIPGDGGAWFLPRILGWQRAAELAFTGRIIDAEEALSLGLVLGVVEPEELNDRVNELAGSIAAQPPHSIRLTKRLMRHSRTSGLDEFLDFTAAVQAISHHTEDHVEAMEAFFDKRSGNFQGQ